MSRRAVRAALSLATACVLLYALSVTLLDAAHVAASLLQVADDAGGHAAAKGALTAALARAEVPDPGAAAATVLDSPELRAALTSAAGGQGPGSADAVAGAVSVLDPALGDRAHAILIRATAAGGTSRSPLVWLSAHAGTLVPAGLVVAAALLCCAAAVPRRTRSVLRSVGRWAGGFGLVGLTLAWAGPVVALRISDDDVLLLGAHLLRAFFAPLVAPSAALALVGVAATLAAHYVDRRPLGLVAAWRGRAQHPPAHAAGQEAPEVTQCDPVPVSSGQFDPRTVAP